MPELTVSDGLNRTVWDDPHAVRGYRAASGFTDPGEEAAYDRVRGLLRERDADILDLGVGGGRTVPLLAPLARRYVALDYSPAMVAACRERHPSVDVRVGDARDLGCFAGGSFALVAFSFNGIDAVGHEARAEVLREVARVLEPNGLFWLSTLNVEGAGLRLRPWIPEWPSPEGNALRRALRAAHMLARMPRRILNYARLRPLFREGPGWAINTLSAHDYNLLVHYTTLAREYDELAEHGFAIDEVFESGEGRRLTRTADTADTADTGGAFWFHILARRTSRYDDVTIARASATSAASSRCASSRASRRLATSRRRPSVEK